MLAAEAKTADANVNSFKLRAQYLCRAVSWAGRRPSEGRLRLYGEGGGRWPTMLTAESLRTVEEKFVAGRWAEYDAGRSFQYALVLRDLVTAESPNLQSG
jgi:hypothetical protein